MNYVTHLECGLTGERHEARTLQGLSRAGRPLLVRYDLAAIQSDVDRDDVWARDGGFWKWRELLPVEHTTNISALGEVDTPLLPLPRLAGSNVVVKDEGRLPTGSFKARGLALAVSMGKELGVDAFTMPTNGNAGAALSAYAARVGLRARCYAPADTPEINLAEIALQGGEVIRVDGLITDCGKLSKAYAAETGAFDVSTLKEPYRIEGKKTMGLELAAQFGWRLPDAIFYPTGGGTGLIGMWKAFAELKALGWLEADVLPKMIAVQAEGCAPIVRAFDQRERFAEPWADAHTLAAGIRVPAAVGDFLILDAVRESEGWAVAIPEATIFEARDTVAREEGLLLCPEGAATFAAWRQAVEEGRLAADAPAVLFNCATGLKYPMPSPPGAPVSKPSA
ncbi:MAG: threonine synthase [Maricaulaceae bacterium]